jgi:hypothetical protein
MSKGNRKIAYRPRIKTDKATGLITNMRPHETTIAFDLTEEMIAAGDLFPTGKDRDKYGTTLLDYWVTEAEQRFNADRPTDVPYRNRASCRYFISRMFAARFYAGDLPEYYAPLSQAITAVFHAACIEADAIGISNGLGFRATVQLISDARVADGFNPVDVTECCDHLELFI